VTISLVVSRASRAVCQLDVRVPRRAEDGHVPPALAARQAASALIIRKPRPCLITVPADRHLMLRAVRVWIVDILPIACVHASVRARLLLAETGLDRGVGYASFESCGQLGWRNIVSERGRFAVSQYGLYPRHILGMLQRCGQGVKS
jgi:hypothetical protein